MAFHTKSVTLTNVGHNHPPPVEIGLTDLPKSPPAHPDSDIPDCATTGNLSMHKYRVTIQIGIYLK